MLLPSGLTFGCDTDLLRDATVCQKATLRGGGDSVADCDPIAAWTLGAILGATTTIQKTSQKDLVRFAYNQCEAEARIPSKHPLGACRQVLAAGDGSAADI